MAPSRAQEVLERTQKFHDQEREEMFQLIGAVAEGLIKGQAGTMKAIDNLARMMSGMFR
jgi:hypothetical protein